MAEKKGLADGGRKLYESIFEVSPDNGLNLTILQKMKRNRPNFSEFDTKSPLNSIGLIDGNKIQVLNSLISEIDANQGLDKIFAVKNVNLEDQGKIIYELASVGLSYLPAKRYPTEEHNEPQFSIAQKLFSKALEWQLDHSTSPLEISHKSPLSKAVVDMSYLDNGHQLESRVHQYVSDVDEIVKSTAQHYLRARKADYKVYDIATSFLSSLCTSSLTTEKENGPVLFQSLLYPTNLNGHLPGNRDYRPKFIKTLLDVKSTLTPDETIIFNKNVLQQYESMVDYAIAKGLFDMNMVTKYSELEALIKLASTFELDSIRARLILIVSTKLNNKLESNERLKELFKGYAIGQTRDISKIESAGSDVAEHLRKYSINYPHLNLLFV